MKAVVITEFGLPDVLKVQEKTIPIISSGEVLIRVMAAGVNRLDIYQRQGNYPAPQGVPRDIPGVEVAGVIEAMGDQVTQWKIGDKVCALVGGGGYADFVKVVAAHCLPVPDKFTFTEAASLPEGIFTVWSNVFMRGQLQEQENFLVHGGSSGIGITSIQLAKALGARVFATAGSQSKCAACESLGADLCVNYKEQDFEKSLASVGLDVILDMVGGDYFQKNINLLNPEGRLIYINAMQGRSVNLDILQVMRKRITISGSTLRSREDSYKTMLTSEIRRKVWPLLATGKFRAVVDRVFPMKQAAEAHRHMETSQHIGKIVLTN
ncbi:MAG: NAD(P)H-quinone oxidoreductase [Saprospiraceae bacterium]|nr:NAD(P)H-quinone oxidoreductase [Saprospiraceae bacterium]